MRLQPTRGWLVQIHNLGVSQQRHGHRQAALHAARVSAGALRGGIRQPNLRLGGEINQAEGREWGKA